MIAIALTPSRGEWNQNFFNRVSIQPRLVHMSHAAYRARNDLEGAAAKGEIVKICCSRSLHVFLLYSSGDEGLTQKLMKRIPSGTILLRDHDDNHNIEEIRAMKQILIDGEWWRPRLTTADEAAAKLFAANLEADGKRTIIKNSQAEATPIDGYRVVFQPQSPIVFTIYEVVVTQPRVWA